MGSEPKKANTGHANFVHLRVKSPYSLLEGAVRPEELASLARDRSVTPMFLGIVAGRS